MGLMSIQPIQPFTPPESLGLHPAAERGVWYPLHDDTAAAHSCRLGLGPELTLTGTVGTFWSATRGAVTPDGATHRLGGPAGDAYLNPLFDLSTIAGQELLVSWSFEHDGDTASTETFWTFGRQTAGAGTGGLRISLSTAEQMILNVQAGLGASGIVANGFANSATTGVTARSICVLSLIGTGGTFLQARMHRHLVGTGTLDSSTINAFDMRGNGGSGPAAEAVSRLTLCANESGTNSYSQYLGATAGSNSKMRNFCALRLASIEDGLAEQGLADLILAPQEFPRSWRA
jgi:hypothetical protein